MYEKKKCSFYNDCRFLRVSFDLLKPTFVQWRGDGDTCKNSIACGFLVSTCTLYRNVSGLEVAVDLKNSWPCDLIRILAILGY